MAVPRLSATGLNDVHPQPRQDDDARLGRGDRRQRAARLARRGGDAQPAGRRLPGRNPSGQHQGRRDRRPTGAEEPGRAEAARRPCRHHDAAGDRAAAGAGAGRAWHARGRRHHRGLRRGQCALAQAHPARRPAASAENRRAELHRLRSTSDRPQRQLRAGPAQGRAHRRRRAVGRRAGRARRLGHRAEHRLLAPDLHGRHDRRRLRRRSGHAGARLRHARRADVRRRHHPGPQVHVGRAQRRAREAGDRAEGGPPCRRRQGRGLAHRRHGGIGRGL